MRLAPVFAIFSGLIPYTLQGSRNGGRILLFGVPSAGKNFDLEAFRIFQKELAILSSYTSVRNSYQAVNLLLTGQVKIESLISNRLKSGQEIPNAPSIIADQDDAKEWVSSFPVLKNIMDEVCALTIVADQEKSWGLTLCKRLYLIQYCV